MYWLRTPRSLWEENKLPVLLYCSPTQLFTTEGAGKEKVDRSADQTLRRNQDLVFECEEYGGEGIQVAFSVSLTQDTTRELEDQPDKGIWQERCMVRNQMIMESEQKKEDQEEFRYWTSLEINAEDKANQRGLVSKTLNLAKTQTLHDYKCKEQFPVI